MKSFKKIIVPAIAAIALCLSLIAGATYAWFTDEAKTNVNTIQSGKLDVALEMKEGDGWVSAEGKTLSFLKMNAEGELVADENVLWEPGCTYKLPLLRIVNNSNVAIKYTVMFNGATGDTQLLNALTFTTKVTRYRPTGSSYNTVYSNFGGQLFAGTIVSKPDENGEGFAFAEMQITVKMKKEAGNEYQNLTIRNMAITVKATQAPYEYDSIDNKYDDGLSFEGSLSFENGSASISTGTKVTQPNGVALNVTGANTQVTVNGGDFDGGEGGDNICVWAGNGANLKINKGEIHVIMGPNGSGKTTTANAILNNPEYKKVKGNIEFDGEDITNSKTDEIARKGIFMSFQLPEEIPGISVTNFLKYAKNKVTGKPVKIFEFKDELKKYMEDLNMNPKNMERSLNVGFSGGEKKKNEILQMLVLNPKLAILDETDSGLDVDAIKTVSKGIEMFKNDENAVLIITHNNKILHSLKVDYVHVLVDGKIVATGTQELATEIEENGYSKYKKMSK